jgi:hypothetical protein
LSYEVVERGMSLIVAACPGVHDPADDARAVAAVLVAVGGVDGVVQVGSASAKVTSLSTPPARM